MFAVCSANPAISWVLRSDSGKYSGNTANFVELKTSLTIRGAADEARFEKYAPISSSCGISHSVPHRKLLKFYLQSFLLGVPVR